MQRHPGFLINGRFRHRAVSGVERYAFETSRWFRSPHRFLTPRRPAQGITGHLWEQLALPALVGRGMLWSPANTGPLAVAHQVLTIHDLGPLDHPEWYRPAFAAWYRWLWPRLAARVRTVVAVSVFTRKRITARLGLPEDRVVLAPVGVDPAHFVPRSQREIDGVRSRYGLPARYILFVGTVQPRKNLVGLSRAVSAERLDFPDVQLVAAGGRGEGFAPVKGDFEGVLFLGRVPDGELPALYSGAAAFIQPSFYEGAALTALEAMACGCPVAVAGGSALEEYAGEAGLVFDPDDRDSIAGALRALLGDDAVRRRLREAGLERAREFSWQRTAEAIETAAGFRRPPGSP